MDICVLVEPEWPPVGRLQDCSFCSSWQQFSLTLLGATANLLAMTGSQELLSVMSGLIEGVASWVHTEQHHTAPQTFIMNLHCGGESYSDITTGTSTRTQLRRTRVVQPSTADGDRKALLGWGGGERSYPGFCHRDALVPHVQLQVHLYHVINRVLQNTNVDRPTILM